MTTYESRRVATRAKSPLFYFSAHGLIVLTLAALAPGCLKTRAQLHDDPANPSASDDPGDAPAAVAKGQGSPQPGHVQDVQPQGSYAIDEIKSTLTQLQGRIEDLERAKQDANADTKKSQATQEQISKLEGRITELEHAQEQMIQQIQKMQQSQATAAMTPEDAIQVGKTAMDAGNYDSAIDSFTLALKSAKGRAAEDATLLRGDCYFSEKQYKKAIIDYSKFPEKYTKSHYMPRALLRIGESFDALGMNDDAKGFYQELTDKFPKSKEAKQVRPKMK